MDVSAHVATVSGHADDRCQQITPHTDADIDVTVAGLAESPEQFHADILVVLEAVPQHGHLGQTAFRCLWVLERNHLDEQLK